MKLKTAGIILVWLASVGFVCASTNDVTTLVQKGLFEEEANHHLDAAMEYYKEAIGNFDKDRQLAATAIFHLGECYRLQGKTNEANVQYQRIVHEFSDQLQLVELSRGYLTKEIAHSSFPQSFTMTSDIPNVDPSSLAAAGERQEIKQINDLIQNSPDLVIGSSRLISEVKQGYLSVVKLLLDNGASINPVAIQGQMTPLTAAIAAGNKGMIELLISKGANINALDGHLGWAPLHYAVAQGFKSIAETLLAHGADVDVPDHDGDRPLHHAVSEGYTTMAEMLLAHKADINAPGNNGESALFRAIQNNNVEMVQFLISNKANVNFKSNSGEAPFFSAVWKHDIDIAIVKALLDNGADVEATVGKHYPLDIAINYGRDDLVELLLQKNADLNTKSPWNVQQRIYKPGPASLERIVTPLILAISKGAEAHIKIIALLLQHSANPNLADETGETALDYAMQYGDTNIIGDLISHHADVNVPDKQGDPPLAYVSLFWGAGSTRGGQIKQMLIQAGANEDYLRRGGIFITQKGTGSIGHKVFSEGTNSVNRVTLFELIATVYLDGTGAIAFPDFAHVTINRLKPAGSKEEIAIDLNEILQSGDCSKNLWLEWGDIVLIPQLDHRVNESWLGLTQPERNTLVKCLLRKVKAIVKGQTTQLDLVPPIVYEYAVNENGKSWRRTSIGLNSRRSPSTDAASGDKILYDFDLNQVVHDANVLLISSDLTRVKVTRPEANAGGHPLVMEFNLEAQPPPALLLLDGDVIEIPERDQGVSQAK